MKRLTLALVCLGLAAIGERTMAAQAKVIGYYMDASDDYYKAGFMVFKELATKAGWEVRDVVGQGTAPEQLDACQNFITQKVDALSWSRTRRRPAPSA